METDTLEETQAPATTPADAEAVLAEVEMSWAIEDETRELGADHTDDEKFSDWYVGKVLALEAELQLLEDQHKRRMRAIEGRLAGVRRYGQTRAEAYLSAAMAKRKGKGKFVDLPHGRLGFRAKAATVDYSRDPERVRKFAEDYPPAAEAFVMNQPPPRPEVRIKPLAAALESWLMEHGGECPPGLLYIGPRDEMYVAPPK